MDIRKGVVCGGKIYSKQDTYNFFERLAWLVERCRDDTNCSFQYFSEYYDEKIWNCYIRCRVGVPMIQIRAVIDADGEYIDIHRRCSNSTGYATWSRLKPCDLKFRSVRRFRKRQTIDFTGDNANHPRMSFEDIICDFMDASVLFLPEGITGNGESFAHLVSAIQTAFAAC